MSNIVGQVAKIEGVVKAINPETGEARILQEGSQVYAGEIIQTSGKGGVVIEMNNGTLLTLGRDTQMRLDDDVTSQANFLDSGTEGAVDIEALQQAVLEGNFDALEETAAGDALLVGSASDGGVFVERIAAEGEVTAGFNTSISEQAFDDVQRGNILQTQQATQGGFPTITIYAAGLDKTPNILDDNTRTVYEKGLNDVADDSEASRGQINLDSPDGIREVSIGGYTLTSTELELINSQPVEIDTGEGVLTLEAFDSSTGDLSYYYEVKDAQDHSQGDVVDDVAITLVDTDGDVAEAVLQIQIIDTAPVANNDVNSITEDSATVIGNVITTGAGADTLGADGASVTATGTASYGSISINPDGSYTYTLDNSLPAVQALNDGETLTDTISYTISYTITDGDGDTSTADLVITINGQTDGVPQINITDEDLGLTPADNSVVEATGDTVTGTMSVSAEAGIASVTVAGQDISNASTTPVVILGTEGTLTITGYDAGTGAISYSYVEDGDAETHNATDDNIVDSFTVSVTDVAGQTSTDDLDIQIIDTAPVAADDAGSIDEDTASVSVDAANGVLSNDAQGADGASVTATGTASYGSISINPDGSYTYTLDNSLPAVQALNDGETLTDTISYTITDGDGDTSTADLVITINGQTDGVPQINITDEDLGLTPADNSVVEATGDTVTGTMSVSAEAGIASVTVAGQDISNASTTPVVILGTEGTLTITGYDAGTGAISYSYVEDGDAETHNATDDNIVDSFTVSVTDVAGQTSTDDLDIQIIDTAPVAADDAGSIDEDTASVSVDAANGVLSNDAQGADGASVTATGTASYGSISINPDGSYTYTLDNSLPAVQALNDGETLTDTISYTITDGDGDTSTADLVITINGQTDGVPQINITDEDLGLTPADNSVVEATGDTVTGTMSVSAEAGIASVTVAGQDISNASTTPVVILGTEGTLTITGYDAGTGAISYSYVEDGDAETHNATDDNIVDSFTVSVTDVAGQTSTDDLDIQIIDTAPVAADDAGSIDEDTASVSVDAANGVLSNDAQGADGASVTATGTASYGSISINPDGSYTYTLDNSLPAVQALNDGETLTDTISYTITDGDGDTSTADLVITINGQTDGVPQINITDEDLGLTPADNSVVEATGDTVTGTMSVSAEAGIASVTVAGQDISNASTTPVVILGTEGTLTITGYDAGTGAISYSYVEDGDAETHNATDDNIVDSFTVSVTDVAGQTSTDDLDIQIIDTAPVAADDAGSIDEDTASVSVDAANGVLSNDAQGADGASVTATGTASYGSISINPDGSYTYTLDNSLPAVQALNDGETLTDTISYTITDGDGDTSTADLVITINGQTDGVPQINITDEDLGLTPADNSVVEATGDTVTGTMSVSAEAGIASVTVAGQDISNASTTPVVILGTEGTLTITGYDAGTGAISYSYVEDGDAETHNATDDNIVDSFTVSVTDVAGQTSTDDLDIQIIDTAPVAADDAGSIDEDTASVSVDAANGVLSNDAQGADGASVTATGTASYGSISINPDGSYTYTLDNSLPAVQALNDGETLTDTISYTITDGDGDTSTADLVITINGQTDGVPQINITDEDLGLTPADNSVVEATGDTVTGTMSVSAEAGIASVTVAGQDISNASTTPVVILGTEGTLTITGYDAGTGAISYSYVEDGDAETHNATDDNIVDSFTVSVTDVAGQTSTDDLDIQIIDTAPVAADDAGSIDEDTASVSVDAANGVLSNDAQGADGASVTATGTASYGSISINPDGSYTYTLDNSLPAVQALNDGETLTDTISYTITDGDGDTSTADLVITINGQTDGVPQINITDEDLGLTPADNSVVEATGDTVTGTMSVSAEAGIASVTVAGQDISNASTTPVVILGTEGTLTITGYDAGTGAISYSYVEDGDAETHNATDDNIVDSFTVSVTDVAGQTSTDDLDIQIIDTAPVAADDAGSIDEDTASVSVDAANGVLSNDAQGADGASVTATGTASYGSISINPDGSYTYTLDNSLPAVQALNDGETLTDTISYTITDGDGDTSTADLVITINGQTDGVPQINITDEDLGLTPADNSVVEATGDTVTGTMSVSAEAGIASVTVAGQDISNASTTPVVILGTEGTLTITGYDAGTGAISYSYVEDGDAETHNATDDNIVDSFTVSVTDVAGQTSTDDLDIQIIDTAPVAADDAGSIDEDTASVSVDAANGVLSNDAQGADGASVTATGTASYGSISINPDGSYTYTLDNSLPAVQALNDGETLTDTISYTITDGDGDTSTADLVITINGQTDGVPQINITDEDLGLTPADNSVVEATGDTVTGTMSVSAEAGIASVTVAGQDISNASTTPVVILGTEGTLTITGYDAGTGAISYSYVEDGDAETHNATDDNIVDSFTVSVTDVAGQTSTDDLDIQIIDTAPVAADDAGSIDEDTASVSVDAANGVLSNDAQGADGASVTATGTASYGSISINPDGSYTYTLDNSLPAVQALNDGETLTDTISYTITDGDGDTSTADLVITINGQQDAPTCTPGQVFTNEDTAYVYTLADFNFSDVDNGDTLSAVRIDSLPADGTLLLNGVAVTASQEISAADISAGNLTFSPDLHESGDDDFSSVGTGDQQTDYAAFDFSVSDGTTWSNTSTMTVDVAAVADAPTLTVTASAYEDATIDISNVTSADQGFTVTPYNVNGSAGTISINNSPEGFGVVGASSGDNSEIGYTASGTEMIAVNFDEDVTSVDVTVAWNAAGENIEIAFYNNGVLINTMQTGGGTDGVDDLGTLEASGGQAFDEIRFYPPAADDDFLIHSISFEKLGSPSDNVVTDEYSSVELNVSASWDDNDGSEVHSLSLTDIPDGFTVTDGVNSFTADTVNGSVDITGWDLANLMLNVPTVDATATYTINAVATTVETSNNDTASVTAPIVITVNDVPGLVVLNTDSVEVQEADILDMGTNGSTTAEFVTGNIFANDVLSSGSTLSGISIAGGTTDTSVAGQITVTTAEGNTLVVNSDSTSASFGDYVYVLNNAVTHSLSDDIDVDRFSYTVTNSLGDDYTALLNVNITDDAPVASNITHEVTPQTQTFNVMLVLDFSGSMKGQNLVEMKAAVQNMLNLYKEQGDVAVQIVNFATTADTRSDGGWVSADAAIAYINSLTDATLDNDSLGSRTNYDAALAEAMDAFAETNGKITDSNVTNISYFLSDGAPNEADGNTSLLLNQSGGSDDGIQATEQTIWENFLTQNSIDSYAVGFDGADVTANGSLAPVAYSGINGEQIDPVDGTSDLTSALADTLPPAISGDLLTGNINDSGFGIGGDGGFVGQVVVGGAIYNFDGNALTVVGSGDYSFDAVNNVLTINTPKGSQLIVDMDDGDYSLATKPNTASPYSEYVKFTLNDNDGDSAAGVVTFNIVPVDYVGPVAMDEVNMVTSQNTSEVTTGNVMDNIDFGAGGTGQIDSISYNGTSYTAAAYPSGVVISLDNGGLIQFDFATGAYTFNNTAGSATALETLVISASDANGNSESFNLKLSAAGSINIISSPTTESFTDGSADNGVEITSSANGSPIITYNGTNGVGVNSQNDRYSDSADSGDNLIFTFDSSLYPNGVESISLDFGYDAGTGTAIFYDSSNNVISSVGLTGADTQSFSGITGVAKVEISTGSNGDYSVQAISFQPVASTEEIGDILYGDYAEAEQFIINSDEDVTLVDFDVYEDVLDISEVIDAGENVTHNTLAEYLDFALVDTDGDGQDDSTQINIDSNGSDAGGTVTSVFIQDQQLTENDIDDLNIDFQND